MFPVLHKKTEKVCLPHTTFYLLIAKSEKPLTIREELILPAVKEVYSCHLGELHKDMPERFQDLLSVLIPDWIMNPFLNTCSEELTGRMEEELILRENGIELKPRFRTSH